MEAQEDCKTRIQILNRKHCCTLALVFLTSFSLILAAAHFVPPSLEYTDLAADSLAPPNIFQASPKNQVLFLVAHPAKDSEFEAKIGITLR